MYFCIVGFVTTLPCVSRSVLFLPNLEAPLKGADRTLYIVFLGIGREFLKHTAADNENTVFVSFIRINVLLRFCILRF
jgi:hypothetical protein